MLNRRHHVDLELGMKTKPRVLVVDDAAVVRRLVIERIEADPELDLAGSAADGARALEMVAAD